MTDSASLDIKRLSDPTPNTRTLPAKAKVFYGSFEQRPEPLPAEYREIDERIAQSEAQADRKTKIMEARRKIAQAFYADSPSLAAMRLKNGLSQAALAKLVGTSQSHIARLEKGEDDIRLSTARRLADALDADLETIANSLKKA